MKKIGSGIAAFSMCAILSAQAQTAPAIRQCAEAKIQHAQMLKTTVADIAEDDYDVQHVKLDLTMKSTNTAMSGTTTTTARVVASSMAAYVFELNPLLTIDSAKVNGQALPVATNGDVRTMALPASLPQSSIFTAEVSYHGQITGGSGFGAIGISNQTSPSWGTRVTYTLSESYESKDWWACKQSLRDKIDSADVWITVPDSCKAGSNGLLRQITPMGNGKDRYEWHTGYAIDYYLLSASVAPYVDYSFYVHFPNSTDSMLVQNYVYTNPSTLPFWQDEIDSVGLMINYFSDLYGRYPFWQEKYGHCMAPVSGGMEHQTMTTLGNFDPSLSVHELGHQWFGDHVTCATWKDIWLNEGFASYTEYLFVHHFYSATEGFSLMQGLHNSVMADTGGSVYVPDTTDENRIFDSRLTYDKGSAVIHTLRSIVNNDSIFYAMLQGYQQQFAFGTATTDDLQQYAEGFLGIDLDDFFNQWIYGEGYPSYTATWNQSGSNVYVMLGETVSSAAITPFFHVPVEVKLAGAQGDTVVRLDHQSNGQLFSFQWSKPVSVISIDPNDWLINDISSIIHNPALDVQSLQRSDIHVFPNPATNNWQLGNLPQSCSLALTDISGRIVWRGYTNTGSTIVPADQLPQGMYLLRISNATCHISLKLIKQ